MKCHKNQPIVTEHHQSTTWESPESNAESSDNSAQHRQETLRIHDMFSNNDLMKKTMILTRRHYAGLQFVLRNFAVGVTPVGSRHHASLQRALRKFAVGITQVCSLHYASLHSALHQFAVCIIPVCSRHYASLQSWLTDSEN